VTTAAADKQNARNRASTARLREAAKRTRDAIRAVVFAPDTKRWDVAAVLVRPATDADQFETTEFDGRKIRVARVKGDAE
jgi:hypothetical protein